LKLLFIGDIFGSLGRTIIERELPRIKEQYQPHVIIANGENITHGHGISLEHFTWLMEQGVHVVTMGNHTWGNKGIHEAMAKSNKLIVPANYLPGVPGHKDVTFKFNQTSIRVINLLGQVFMNDAVESPFLVIDRMLEQSTADITIVDFHAETTSEKVAFGLYVDGRVTAVLGTHTHVPTADARILPKGTAYQTDVGMNGALDSVIGMRANEVVAKFVDGYPRKYQPEEQFPAQLNMTLLTIENNVVKTIQPIHETFPH
jgi:2',3'-cyclic-nucleotide 2'-phosphodiesterase